MKTLMAIFVQVIVFSWKAQAWAQTQAAPSQAAESTAKKLFTANVDTARKLWDLLVEFVVKYSFQVLGGIIILAIGWYLSKLFARIFSNFLKKHNVDITVSKFLVECLKITIIALSGLIALGNFGITIAPFVAGLSVAGFGLSFALQGPLSNYAAGATLIFTKPFKVGDIIEVTGVVGEVEDMTLARTLIRTPDGTIIVVPNKQIIGEIIHNYSDHKKQDVKVGIAYDSDVEKAIMIIKSIIEKDERVSKRPLPKVGIAEFGDSSINLYARFWSKQSEYWDVLFDVNKMIFDEFKKNGVNIPFPRRDVHIYNKS